MSFGSRVLIVDDLIATGGTIKACGELVGALGGNIVGVVTLIDLVDVRDEGCVAGLKVRTLLKY